MATIDVITAYREKLMDINNKIKALQSQVPTPEVFKRAMRLVKLREFLIKSIKMLEHVDSVAFATI